MSVSADWSEVNELAADLGKAGLGAASKAQQVVAKAAADVQRTGAATAQQLFKPPPEGASTGATANSIGVDLENGGLAASIGPTTSYAAYLEFGTRRMSPRPFMGPALDAVEPSFTAAMGQLGGDIL